MTVIKLCEAGRPGRPLLARAGEALALGVRAGRHQRQREHQGRGRLARRSTSKRRSTAATSSPTSRRSRAWPTRRRASSSCSTAWACRSTARPRACSTSVASAARSSTAPRSPARPPGSSSSTRSTSRCAATRRSTSRTSSGVVIPGEKMVRKFEFWDFLALVLDDDGRRARHRRAGPQDRWRSSAFPGDAVCLATGGPGIVFGRSTNSVINTGTAASAVYQQGACYANGEFIQVHPTAIPGADKLRLISESARGEGGRVWVPKDREGEAPRHATSPRASATTSSRRSTPGYGNLVPRDIASRELFLKCFHEEQRRLQREDAARTRTRSTSTSRTSRRRCSGRSSRASSRSTRSSSARTRTRTRCASSPPCTTRWAACGSTSSARATARSSSGSPRNQATNIPGLYAAGEVRLPVPRRQPPRRQLAPLVHLRRHGRPGPAMATLPRRTSTKSAFDLSSVALRARPRSASRRSTKRILEDGRRREPVPAPRGARRRRCSSTAPSSGTTTSSTRCSRRSTRSTSARSDVGVTDTATAREPGRAVRAAPREHARRSRASSRRARATATSRAARTSSPTFNERDDANWLRTTLAFHAGGEHGDRSVGQLRARARLHAARQAVHVTDAVDIEPREAARAQVRDGRRGQRRGDRASERRRARASDGSRRARARRRASES